MDIISRIINFFMTLIGLVVFAFITYVFVYDKWKDHREQQYQADREEFISEITQSSRAQGLGDLEELPVKGVVTI